MADVRDVESETATGRVAEPQRRGPSGRAMYIVRSVGAPGNFADSRYEATEGLGYALAIFGAEATLRLTAGVGSVSLYDADGFELIAYHDERLYVTVARGRDPAPNGGQESWWVQRPLGE